MPTQNLNEAAEEIYRKINSYANPTEMRGIEKSWIIQKIKEGLTDWANQQSAFDANILIVKRDEQGNLIKQTPADNQS